MRLADLLADLPVAVVEGEPSVEIAGVAYDSRGGDAGRALRRAARRLHRRTSLRGRGGRARRGGGAGRADGRGAWAGGAGGRLRYAAALARVAARFYGPSRQLGVIGVTGTDGKTTTTYFIDKLLETAGLKSGLIGTVDIKIGPIGSAIRRARRRPSRWRSRRCCGGWSTPASTGQSSSRPRTGWRCIGSTSPMMSPC